VISLHPAVIRLLASWRDARVNGGAERTFDFDTTRKSQQDNTQL